MGAVIRLPCPACGDIGWVCEAHADRPWDDHPNACGCGEPGMPCPACNPAGCISEPAAKISVPTIEPDARTQCHGIGHIVIVYRLQSVSNIFAIALVLTLFGTVTPTYASPKTQAGGSTWTVGTHLRRIFVVRKNNLIIPQTR
jgi:hypothetical protein